MLCPQCHKQIADNSAQCPHCAFQVDHRAQVPKEISLRRYQRWFFYGLISFMFLGMIVTIAKINSVNSDLLSKMALSGQELAKKNSELEAANASMATATKALMERDKILDDTKKELAGETDKYKELLFEKQGVEEKYKSEKVSKDEAVKSKTDCESRLSQTDAMIYEMILTLGMGVSNNNLKKIPVADANFKGQDTDADGLSDIVEAALGTDKNKRDTDSDGFEDKREVLGHFNPGGAGSMPLDQNFANAMKGRVLLQVERNGEAWYVNPDDGKKYFLGRPGDALKVLSSLK